MSMKGYIPDHPPEHHQIMTTQYANSSNEPPITDVNERVYPISRKKCLWRKGFQPTPNKDHCKCLWQDSPYSASAKNSSISVRTSTHASRHHETHSNQNDASFYHMERAARYNEALRRATISYKSTVLYDGNNLSASNGQSLTRHWLYSVVYSLVAWM